MLRPQIKKQNQKIANKQGRQVEQWHWQVSPGGDGDACVLHSHKVGDASITECGGWMQGLNDMEKQWDNVWIILRSAGRLFFLNVEGCYYFP